MSLYVLDAIIWIIGIRGHIPQNEDYRAGPGNSSHASGTLRMMWVLAAFVAIVVILSLALWASVWLAIKLL